MDRTWERGGIESRACAVPLFMCVCSHPINFGRPSIPFGIALRRKANTRAPPHLLFLDIPSAVHGFILPQIPFCCQLESNFVLAVRGGNMREKRLQQQHCTMPFYACIAHGGISRQLGCVQQQNLTDVHLLILWHT